jgi:hypothetical protein
MWGLGFAALATGVAGLLWGRSALPGAAVFGVTAVGLQLLAARAMRRTGRPPSLDQLSVYVTGVVLRLLGVVALAVAITVDRRVFPPLASATGYLGTVLPLLYLETRLAR